MHKNCVHATKFKGLEMQIQPMTEEQKKASASGRALQAPVLEWRKIRINYDFSGESNFYWFNPIRCGSICSGEHISGWRLPDEQENPPEGPELLSDGPKGQLGSHIVNDKFYLQRSHNSCIREPTYRPQHLCQSRERRCEILFCSSQFLHSESNRQQTNRGNLLP